MDSETTEIKGTKINRKLVDGWPLILMVSAVGAYAALCLAVLVLGMVTVQ